MKTIICLSQKAYHESLDEFLKATKEKKYNRIKHNLWKNITKYKLARYNFELSVSSFIDAGNINYAGIIIYVYDTELGYAVDSFNFGCLVDSFDIPYKCGLYKFFIDKYFKNKKMNKDEDKIY